MNFIRQSSIKGFFAGGMSLAAFALTAQNGSISLAWNASPSPNVAGYEVYYGETSGNYTSSAVAGTNLNAMISGLTPGIIYYFSVAGYTTNNILSAFSTEVSSEVLAAAITTEPVSQSAVAGSSVTFSVGAAGVGALQYQWLNGSSPIAGATSSSYMVAKAGAGSYSVVVSDAWGSVTSSVAALTLITPPSIFAQPQPQAVVASTTATFTAQVSSAAPVSFQWYCASAPLPGATNGVLILTNVGGSNEANYKFTASNVAGAVTSTPALLTVLAKNTFAPEAGVYNGLFYQTNADGSADVTEATAGFLGNFVLASTGVFSTTLSVGGQSYYWSGNFNVNGSCGTTIIQSNGIAASVLSVTLQLNTNGAQQITGLVSNMVSSNAWTAPLMAFMATNTFRTLSGVSMTMSPEATANGPTNSGAASGLVSATVLSMAGALGDGTSFSQSVPISQSGYVPVYASLYNNGGLLAGWINISGGKVAGSLAWIRPSGVTAPAGFPQGFDTLVNVTGATH